MLIIRRSKLHYTASGIITAVGGRLVHVCVCVCVCVRVCVYIYLFIYLLTFADRASQYIYLAI